MASAVIVLFCEVLTLRIASGILPAMFFFSFFFSFISSAVFLLRPYDVTFTSNLAFSLFVNAISVELCA